MIRVLRILCLIAIPSLITLSSPGISAVETPDPSPLALKRASKLVGTSLGVDRRGDLWAWNRGSKTLRVLSPAGELTFTRTLDLDLPSEIDFDPEWGIAALDTDRELVVFDPQGGEPSRYPLEKRYGHLAWIGPGRLALAPKNAPYRVEIRQLPGEQPVALWGREEVSPTGPGFHRLRGVLLRYDFERHRLWSLETFTGHLVVFSDQGEVLSELTVPHPRQAELAGFFETTDAEKRKAGETEDTVLNLWPSVALDRRGAAWMVQAYSSETGRLTLLEVSSDQPPREREIKVESCGSLTATVWDTWLIVYRSPVLPGPPCTEARKLPGQSS